MSSTTLTGGGGGGGGGGTKKASRKLVADAACEFLFIEMVHAMQRLAQPKPKPKPVAETSQQEQQEQLQHEQQQQQAVAVKLEAMGFQVGQRLAERCTKDRPRFTEELDIVKFLCKEFWTEVFKKQADKLQTNHKGVYVLHDYQFRWLIHLSPSAQQPGGALMYTYFPNGLIRGLLSNLGIKATVRADIPALPKCSFNIQILSKQF